MDGSPTPRRRVIAAVGMCALAGCTESVPFGSDDGTKTAVSLGSLFVYNQSDETKSVQLQLRREGDLVYEDTVEATQGYERIDPSWSTDPAAYTLLWATDDDLGMGSIPDEYEHVVDSADCYHALFNFDGPFGPAVELHDADELDSGTC